MIAGPRLTFELMEPVCIAEDEFVLRNPGRNITFVLMDKSTIIMDQKE